MLDAALSFCKRLAKVGNGSGDFCGSEMVGGTGRVDESVTGSRRVVFVKKCVNT